MSKISQKISKPGSIKMPQGPMHTDGIEKGSHGRGGQLANPGRSVPMGNSLNRLPIQSPKANLNGKKIGQPNPDTSAAATKKPNRKGGSAFYGES
jgi:hypothetical protein